MVRMMLAMMLNRDIAEVYQKCAIERRIAAIPSIQELGELAEHDGKRMIHSIKEFKQLRHVKTPPAIMPRHL